MPAPMPDAQTPDDELLAVIRQLIAAGTRPTALALREVGVSGSLDGIARRMRMLTRAGRLPRDKSPRRARAEFRSESELEFERESKPGSESEPPTKPRLGGRPRGALSLAVESAAQAMIARGEKPTGAKLLPEFPGRTVLELARVLTDLIKTGRLSIPGNVKGMSIRARVRLVIEQMLIDGETPTPEAVVASLPDAAEATVRVTWRYWHASGSIAGFAYTSPASRRLRQRTVAPTRCAAKAQTRAVDELRRESVLEPTEYDAALAACRGTVQDALAAVREVETEQERRRWHTPPSAPSLTEDDGQLTRLDAAGTRRLVRKYRETVIGRRVWAKVERQGRGGQTRES